MKLVRFNKKTVPSASRIEKGKPFVRVVRTGLIAINKIVSKAMELTAESSVELIRNEDAESEWFLVKSESEDAYKLRPFKSGLGFSFNNSALSVKIIESIKGTTEFKSLAFRVGLIPVEEADEKLFPILTNSWKEFARGGK